MAVDEQNGQFEIFGLAMLLIIGRSRDDGATRSAISPDASLQPVTVLGDFGNLLFLLIFELFMQQRIELSNFFVDFRNSALHDLIGFGSR